MFVGAVKGEVATNSDVDIGGGYVHVTFFELFKEEAYDNNDK